MLYQLSYSRNILVTTIQRKVVEGGGFEPPKAPPTDLQSVPFDRSGIPPHIAYKQAKNPSLMIEFHGAQLELAMGLEPATC